MKITTIEDIVFNYIEFFFSKEELKTMFKIKPLSHHVWLEVLDGMYSSESNELNETNESSETNKSNGSEDSNSDETKFHYNIMHTDAYKNIMKLLQDIKNILIKSDESDHSDRSKMKMQQDIKDIYKKIKEILESEDLHYYEETYVYAHHIFNNIRNNGIKIKGGGKYMKDIKDMSLEEFKDAIREKIKELEL
jgi:hypothetical protein